MSDRSVPLEDWRQGLGWQLGDGATRSGHQLALQTMPGATDEHQLGGWNRAADRALLQSRPRLHHPLQLQRRCPRSRGEFRFVIHEIDL